MVWQSAGVDSVGRGLSSLPGLPSLASTSTAGSLFRAMRQRSASPSFSRLLPSPLLRPLLLLLILLPPSSPLPSSSSASIASRGGAVLPPDAFADAESSFDDYLDSNGMTWSKQSANGSDYDVVPFPSTITSRFAVVRLRDRVPSTGQYYSSHMMRLTNPESLDVVTATGQCRPGSAGESVGQIAAAHKCDYATNAGSISFSQHRRGTTRRQGENQDQGERQRRTLNGNLPSNASSSSSSLPPPSVCGGAVVAEAVLVSEVDARAGSASAPSRASFGISRKRHWTFGYLNSASLLDPDQGGDYVAFVTGAGWLVRNRRDNLQASVDREHLPRGMVERRMARTVLAVGLENDMFILQVDGTGTGTSTSTSTGTSTGTGTVNRTGDTRTHAEAKGAKAAKAAREVAQTDAELLEVASTLGMGVRQGKKAGGKGIFRSSATPRNNVGGAIGASSSSAHRRQGLANSTDPAQYFDSLPGLTLKELTEVLLKLGATQAIALGNAGESMAVWDGDVVSGSCFKRPDRCRAPVQTALCVRRDSSPAAQRRPPSKNLPGRADFMAFASQIRGAPAPSPSGMGNDAIASAMFATAASASSTLPPPPPTPPPQTLDDADAAATRAIADGKGGDGGNGGNGGNTAVTTGLPGTTASSGSAQAQTLQTLLAPAPAQAPAPASLAAPALASPPTPTFAPSAPAPAPIAAPAVDWFSNRRLWEPAITKDTLDKLGTKTGKAASTLLRGVVGSGSSEVKLDSLFAGGGGASGEGGAGSGSGAGSSDDERAAVHRLVSAKVHADEVASGLVDAGGGGAGEEGAEGEAGAEHRAFPAAGHSDEAAAEHRPPARTRASAAVAAAAAGQSGDGMLSTSSMGQKADCTFFAVSC